MGVMLSRTLRGTLLLISLLGTLNAAPKLRLGSTTVGPISVTQGGVGPVQTVEVWNAGDGSLNLSLVPSVSWITAQVAKPTPCTEQVKCQVSIGLKTSALDKGLHTGVITVADPAAVDAPQTITVTVHVGGGVPDKVDLWVAPNGSSDAYRFTTNSNVAGMVNTQDGRRWLSFSVDGSGSFRFVIPYRIEVKPESGMGDGNYNGSVAISKSAFAGDNKAVAVAMHVTSQPIAKVSPEKLQFRVLQNSAKSVQYVAVSNRGLGTLQVGTVAASITSGGNWLSVEDTGAGNYKVTVDPNNVAPGAYKGALAVPSNAANGQLSVPVELEIVSPASPWAYFRGVVNNATFEGDDPVAQGAICALFGEQLSHKDPEEGKVFPLAQELGEARVFVNDKPAPLFYSSYGQINFQMPYDTPAGDALVRVDRRDAVRGNTVSVKVVERAARILPARIGDYGIVVIGNTAVFAMPPMPGLESRRAKAGDALLIYAIGLGQTTPPVASGAQAPAAEPLARVAPAPTVVIGDISPFAPKVSVDPFFVGLTPGYTGLYQINIVVPEGTPKGDSVALYLVQGNVPSNVVRIAVE
jgi:uncharacterized protein (TIGR03437 family)